jgi:hypothetical protein
MKQGLMFDVEQSRFYVKWMRERRRISVDCVERFGTCLYEYKEVWYFDWISLPCTLLLCSSFSSKTRWGEINGVLRS